MKSIAITTIKTKSTAFNKILLIFIILFNISLAIAVIFLMNHVQNLLNSDVKINLTEIVTQNKNVITTKVALDMNSLNMIASKVTDALKRSNATDKESIDIILSSYILEHENNSIFFANSDGIALTKGDAHFNVAGRKYFRLAMTGVANVSDKLISRVDGDEVFIISVPLQHNGTVIGSLQKIYRTKKMHDLFALSLFSDQGYTYVINSDGYTVLHSAHENCQVKSENYLRDIYEVGNHQASNQLKADLQAKKSGFSEITINGTKVFSAYTPLEQVHDWYLITSVPMTAVSPNGNIVIRLFYYILLFFALIFTSILSYLFWYKNKQKLHLENIAFIDSITGSNTYNKFIVEVKNTIIQYPDNKFYILKFDIDNFKYINQSYGFEFGDSVLRQVCHNVRRQLHGNEIIARIFGDNFVVFLDTFDDSRLDLLLSPIDNEEDLTLYFSAGLYEISDPDEGIRLMVDKASTASQTVKGILTKRFEYYSAKFDDSTKKNEQLKRTIKQAISEKEFLPFYQPQVDISTGKLVGAEALARWKTKDNQFIYPNDFIPFCEKTGLIVEVDMIIFEKVLQFLSRHLRDGLPCTPISVNFSRLHLFDTEFFSSLTSKLNQYNVPANLIEIELTESAIFDNMNAIHEFTQHLRETGFLIAMDDFGSGYSSLNMLKDIHIDILKIDKDFLKETMNNERRDIIFASVADMAQKLKIKVIVEGVETLENVKLMEVCCCHIAQGYYFARPMEEAKFEKIFKDGILP